MFSGTHNKGISKMLSSFSSMLFRTQSQRNNHADDASSSSSSSSSSPSSAKKRHTTSTPPEEVAAAFPPRIPTDEPVEKETLQLQLPEVRSMVSSRGMDYLPTYSVPPSASIVALPITPLSADLGCEVERDGDTVMTQDDELPPRPPATLVTLPPEISFHLLQFMPINSHSKLYETCRHFHHLITSNDEYLYTKCIRRAGTNPRNDSLLSRTIFAFQYRSSAQPVQPPSPDVGMEPQNNIQYLRFICHQSDVVMSLTDQLQSAYYYNYFGTTEGTAELRLVAHASHAVEDLYMTDDVDRDLMHLWEFINFSEEQALGSATSSATPEGYPFEEQKGHYAPEWPLMKEVEMEMGAKDDRKLVTKRRKLMPKGMEFPHHAFLGGERKRLREWRNEYWREDSENLSKVESRDMRWILEVLKAAIVGVALSSLVEVEKAVSLDLSTPVAAAAIGEEQPSTPILISSQNSVTINGLTTPPASPPSLASLTTSSTLPTTPGPKFKHTDLRAYTSYLIATGGLKLILRLLKTSRELGRSLTAEELDGLLTSWDARSQGRGRTERVWERDCRRGGWRNWEGWVGEYYVIS